ncbi:4-(cytidine 5'-diphospho)-2-C-methyl-D-erythritol kinase [Jiella sp. M17.18]|uniref:4-(cytidine 5'-diphospho)-2-C-methyl-D-erythritol kinase n=1 Tax=Jiella sp. M17.18 TaxID=3234247 RepID=UPI0034DEF800
MRRLAVPAGETFAPAKVNLALHVVGRRPDGYHLLDSLVVFSDAAGDRLSLAEADGEADGLTIHGRFAHGLPTGPENILLKTLAFARARLAESDLALPPLALRLEKRLPVAAGIGGGSADAAALLRSLMQLAPPDAFDRLASRAVELGADVPMCLDGRPARVSGIGEIIAPLAGLPTLPLLLVNPGVAVSTPAVFAALRRRDNPPLPPIPAEGFPDPAAVADWLGATRNDMETPALSIAPEIADVGRRLLDEGAMIARMSGSGATVFAIFGSDDAMLSARRRIAADRPRWWLSGEDPAARSPA